MKPILLFLALLCGAVAGETPAPKTTGDGRFIFAEKPIFVAVTVDELLGQNPAWRSEAADVVKAMKLLLDYADPKSNMIVTLEYDTSTPAQKAQQYADQLKQREKDIAWARTILAKWEARAK